MSEKKLTGMAEIEKYSGLSTTTIFDFYKHFDLPIEKNDGAWCSTKEALDEWLKENGVRTWFGLTMGRLIEARNRKNRQGPGKEFVGDANQICDRLNISLGTLVIIVRQATCPIKRVPGTNKYSVDMNRWTDYLEDRKKAAAYSGEVGHEFRSKRTTGSDLNRPSVPGNPTTHYDEGGHPLSVGAVRRR